MPILSQFYGIIIKMYFQEAEHQPPHFHVFYGGYEAEFSVQTGELLAGKVPLKTAKLVHKWSVLHREELLNIWNTQEFYKIKPLE